MTEAPGRRAPLQDGGVANLDPGTEKRIRESIGRQTLLTTLGVTVAGLASGRVVLELPYRADLCQQNGYVHAGAIKGAWGPARSAHRTIVAHRPAGAGQRGGGGQ